MTKFSKLSLMAASALIATGVAAFPVFADNSHQSSQYKMSQKTKNQAEKKAELRARDQSVKEALLEGLYQAHVSLHIGDRPGADNAITTILKQLDEVVFSNPDRTDGAETPEYSSYEGYKAVEIEFGGILIPHSVVVPVPNRDLTVEAIAASVSLEGIEQGGIKDSAVRYIAYDVDKEDVRRELEDARYELRKGDLVAARMDLLDAQQSLLESNKTIIPARQRARDQLALTRFLVQRAEYDAARKALDEAELALSDMLIGTDDIQSGQNLISEMKALNKQLSKRDPSMLKMIDEKLDAFWKNLI